MPELDAAAIEGIVRSECRVRGLSMQSLAVDIDLGVWLGSYDTEATDFIKRCYESAGLVYRQADPAYIGFIDVQMLASTIESPTYVIGAGGENRHGANESVALVSLESARKLYQQIITDVLGE